MTELLATQPKPFVVNLPISHLVDYLLSELVLLLARVLELELGPAQALVEILVLAEQLAQVE